MQVGEMITENKTSYKIYYDGYTFQCHNEAFNHAFTGIEMFDCRLSHQLFEIKTYNRDDIIINFEFRLFPYEYCDSYYHTLNTYKQFIDVFFRSIPSYHSLRSSYSHIGEFDGHTLHLWFGKLIIGESPFNKQADITSKIDKDFILRGKITDYLEFRHKELMIENSSLNEFFMALYIINDIVQQN